MPQQSLVIQQVSSYYMHTYVFKNIKCYFVIVEVLFNQSTYVINEETRLLMLAVKLNQASQVPVGIIINVTDTTTTGTVSGVRCLQQFTNVYYV